MTSTIVSHSPLTSKHILCEYCLGTGQVEVRRGEWFRCGRCSGTGRVWIPLAVQTLIDQLETENARLRVSLAGLQAAVAEAQVAMARIREGLILPALREP